MDIRVVFASNLKHYRQARGLTQAALAAELSIARAGLMRVEAKQSADRAAALAVPAEANEAMEGERGSSDPFTFIFARF